MKHPKQLDLDSSKPMFFSAGALFSFLFVFICFFPNPGLPLGASTGLQAGQIVALLSLPTFLVLRLPRRQTLALLLLTFPLLLSGFLAILTGRAISAEVAMNTMGAIVLAIVVLVPIGRIVNKRHTIPLLTGVAWAVVLHAVVGFYQAYWFARDTFPLSGLYQNPSFNSQIQKDPDTWALFVKRPYGLFPEPSAMAASIGPWIILIVGLLLYPRLRRGITRGTTTLLISAVLGGVGLIIISSSGFTMWLLAGLLLVGSPTVKDKILRLHRFENFLALLALVLVGAAIVALSVVYLGFRINIAENASWSARLSSLVWGVSYLGVSPSNLFFGIGPGQSYLILNSPGFLSSLPGSPAQETVIAVWSVVVTYVQETGLPGILALVLIQIMVLRAIVRSSARLMGFSCLIVWLAGVVLTTSYLPLLPIWLFLGVLLGWDKIFEVRAASNSFVSNAVGTSSARRVRI